MNHRILIIAALALCLGGCAAAPADPWAPWYNIPKPVDCGTKAIPVCQEWIEPGMMVHT